MEEYFSDWEYYSDDYYDDDPSVKQTASNPPPAKKARRALAQTSPKANANANRVTRPKTSMDPDISSFQGVVWKTPALDINQDVAIFYEPIGDKVALLKDWREIFKSAQPALNKSRLRKRKIIEDEGEEDENAAAEVSFADDEFPCDDDDDAERRLDSSDQMSDIISMDNSMTDTVDAGDASNTTPELGQSPKPMPVPTSTPAKRGRKRKAEVVADEVGKGNSGTDSVRNRSKRVAGKKGDGEANVSSATSAPTRRSTRQKK